MVRLRLRRVGRKKQPSFRIVAADKESPRDGKFLEVLGFYNPRTEPETITLKEDRIYDWLSKGAQPSDATERIFRTAGLLDRFERYKAGEDVNKLVEESEAWQESHNLSGKTRQDTSAKSEKKAKKADVAAEKPKADAKKAEEPEAKEETAAAADLKIADVGAPAEESEEAAEKNEQTSEPPAEEEKTEE